VSRREEGGFFGNHYALQM